MTQFTFLHRLRNKIHIKKTIVSKSEIPLKFMDALQESMETNILRIGNNVCLVHAFIEIIGETARSK